MSRPLPAPEADPPLGRRFRAFWTAALASNLSDGVAMIAVPWLASSLSSDPLLVAAVATAGRLPWLLLGLPAGVLVDRLPRAALMVSANAARLALWALLAVAVASGWASVPLLAAFAFCFGALEVCYDTAAETAVPALVPPDRLERANGHLRTGSLVAQEFAGRPLGGLLIALGVFVPFLVNIAALAVSVLALLRLRTAAPAGENGSAPGPGTTGLPREGGTGGPRSTTGAGGPGETLAAGRRGLLGVGADVAEGVRAILRQPLLRLVAGISLLVNTSYATALSTQVLFVRETLGLGPAGFGLLMAFAAVGGVIGAQSVTRLRAALPRGVLPTACLASVGTVYVLIAWQPLIPVVALGYLLASGLIIGYSVSLVSIRQRITPDRLLGRVNAAMRTVGWGASAVGMAAGGVLVSALTPSWGHEDALRAPYALIGVVSLAVTAFLGARLTRLVRAYDG